MGYFWENNSGEAQKLSTEIILGEEEEPKILDLKINHKDFRFEEEEPKILDLGPLVQQIDMSPYILAYNVLF